MSSSGPGLRAIVTTNLTLLYAVCLGAVARLLWPETAEGWQFGLFSIVCGLSAFALSIKGFGDVWRYVLRDIGVVRFKRRGREPHSDQMAGNEAMRKSGMIK